MATKLIKISLIVLLLFSLIIPQVLLGPTSNQALAQEPPPDPPPIEPSHPGRVEGTGTFFEITDSESANITLTSTEEIKIDLESIPRMISLIIEAAGDSANSTVLTLEGLEPNKAYFKYEDDFEAKTAFVSDGNGSYVWAQDLSELHVVWIQEEAATIYIPRDALIYGTWDPITRTFTLGQDLNETVVINEDNIIFDGNGHTIKGNGSGIGVVPLGIEDAVIKNLNVEEFSYGFRPNSIRNVAISNSTISKNWRGIQFVYSFNVTVDNNVVSGNRYGIEISNYSSNVTLDGNTISNSRYGGVEILHCHNQHLNGNDISFNNYGVNIYDSNQNVLENNVFSGNGAGIHLQWYSNNNTIEENTFSNNSVLAMQILYSSNNNIVRSNTFLNTSGWGWAIRLYNSGNNTFDNNIISNNSGRAISIVGGLGPPGKTYGNTVRFNTISNNQLGVYVVVAGDSKTKIHHNSFADNVEKPQAYVYPYATRVLFDNGYPSGGNYWSDYTGVDQYSGPNQDQPGSDGIGDTPYIINDFQDRYPLMSPPTKLLAAEFEWSPEEPMHGENITFDASSSIDLLGQIVSYNWTFGDNITGQGRIVTHAYQSAGDYTVTLTVSDNVGFTDSTSETVSVRAWSFAIITDLHIGRGYGDYGGLGSGYSDNGTTGSEPELNYYLTERLNTAVNWINSNKDNPNYNIRFVAVMGDAADSAEKSELLKTKNILDRLNDPNGDGDTTDGIPYVPLFGNHDIWPYTDFEEWPDNETIGQYFEEVFWNSVSNKNLELLESIADNFTRQEDEYQGYPYFQNYAFRYKGIGFLGLDFSSRDHALIGKGTGPGAVYHTKTQEWLEDTLGDLEAEYNGAGPVILLSHHPILPKNYSQVTAANGLHTEIFTYDVMPVLQAYEELDEGKQILGNFAGHIHALGHFPLEFYDANLVYTGYTYYPIIAPYPHNPVVTTEALLVGSNLPDDVPGDDNDLREVNKGIIRIVEVLNAGEVDYSTIGGKYNPDTPSENTKFIALNPRFEYKNGQTDESSGEITAFFYLKAFTKRDVTYRLDCADGTIYESSSEKIEHKYSSLGFYRVILTVTDNATGVEETFPGIVEVEVGVSWWTVLTSPTVKPISTTFWENVAEVGQTTESDVLFNVSHSEVKPVGLATIHFEQANDNIDMTALVADYDTAAQKSVFHMPIWPAEIEEPKVLFIPYSDNGTIYICPNAISLDEVNPHSPGAVFLEPGEIEDGMMAVPVIYKEQEYYLVYGFVNGGGGVNLPPVADANGPYIGEEGSPVIFTAANSTDPNSDPLEYRWDFDNDGIWDTYWLTEPSVEHTWFDNYAGEVEVEIWDGELADNAITTVNVSNAAPTVSDIDASLDPVEVGTEISVSANLTDPGTEDTHEAVWNWGDNITSEGYIDETVGFVSGNHTYTAAGVYTVKLTVIDDDGDSGESIFRFVVIYDPSAGFVTGGGWINSPVGAYADNPSITGKANLGFVAKYQQGEDVPVGQTEFNFRPANLNFHSISYEWLVITGAKAQLKGEGTINGEGTYEFLLTAINADIDDSDDFEVDRFRIKIWEEINGTEVVTYDNALGDDSDNATTELGGGSIVIHAD